jgi:acyl-CoA synthetase (AMP-forming)/AMP-acid ligase II
MFHENGWTLTWTVTRPCTSAAEARCRARLAHFKVARGFTFRELPETATEKIQKFVLRDGRAAISAQ